MFTFSICLDIMKSLTIKFYSDYICPWCYLGKVRLDKLKDRLSDDIDIQIELMPFILYPHIPPGGVPKTDFSKSSKPGMGRSLREEAQLEGISFNYKLIDRIPNSVEAHRLVWLVTDPVQKYALSKKLFYSYFEEGENIEDPNILTKLANDCKVDKSITSQFSSSDAGLEETVASITKAREKHITLVPTLEFNPALQILGLQSDEVWENYLRRAVRLNI